LTCPTIWLPYPIGVILATGVKLTGATRDVVRAAWVYGS
jgi:hypothetical protein